jgi:hypothetical protein
LKIRQAVALLAILMVFSFTVGEAQAEGGNSISSGPLVVYGQQAFGNTALSPHLSDPNGWDQFWNLNVVGGDKLTIDWEATPDTGTRLLLYPVGTSDYTLGSAGPVAQQGENSEGKNELHLTAPATGTMPLVVNTGGHGHSAATSSFTYNFTAYARHSLIITLPRLARLSHRRSLKVDVHTPEGGLISDRGLGVTLEAMARGGHWMRLGRANVENSAAKINVRVPKSLWHGSAAVRATAAGRAYLPTRSRVLHVRVP